MTKTYAFRLLPGQDLKKEIQAFANEQQVEAGWLVSCVGSLTQYHIRFANQHHGTTVSGHFEIITLSGTVSKNGSHLHICVSNNKGETTAGHLLDGNLIYTTAEIILQSSDEWVFTRERDLVTTWRELRVNKRIP